MQRGGNASWKQQKESDKNRKKYLEDYLGDIDARWRFGEGAVKGGARWARGGRGS